MQLSSRKTAKQSGAISEFALSTFEWHLRQRKRTVSVTLKTFRKWQFNPIQTGVGGGFDATRGLKPLLLTNDCIYSVPTS